MASRFEQIGVKPELKQAGSRFESVGLAEPELRWSAEPEPHDVFISPSQQRTPPPIQQEVYGRVAERPLPAEKGLGQATGKVGRTLKQFWNKGVADTAHGLGKSDNPALYKAYEIQKARMAKRKKAGGRKYPEKLLEGEFNDIVRELGELPEAREGEDLKKVSEVFPIGKDINPFPKFNIPPGVDAGDYIADTVAGIGTFLGQLYFLKKALPGAPSQMIWEIQNIATGGKPGRGAAINTALKGISEIPSVSTLGKVTKVTTGGGLFGGLAWKEGGDWVDVAVSTAIGMGFQGWDIHKQNQWLKSFKSHLKKAEYAKSQKAVAEANRTVQEAYRQSLKAGMDPAEAKYKYQRGTRDATRIGERMLKEVGPKIDQAVDIVARKLHHGKLSGQEAKLAQKIAEKGLTRKAVAEVAKIKLPKEKRVELAKKGYTGEGEPERLFKLKPAKGSPAAKMGEPVRPVQPGLAAIAEQIPKPAPTPIEHVVAPVAKVPPKVPTAVTAPSTGITEEKALPEHLQKIADKAKEIESKRGFTITDVTPEGFGPSEAAEPVPSTQLTTEQQRLISTINEAKTILKGDVSGDKRTAIERSLAKAEKELELVARPPAAPAGKGKEPPRPLVNPKASALQQDKQLRRQQAWDRKYGKAAKYISEARPEPLADGAKQRRREILQAKLKRGESVGPKVLAEFESEPWAQEAPAEKPAEKAIEQNFTQFATRRGYPSDYDITDHSMLSPSGKISKRAKGQGLKRLEERIELNKRAHQEFNKAILAGEVVDPSGKVTKEKLLAKQKEKQQKEVEGRLAQIDAQIRFAKSVGKGKRGIKPTAQKRIDELEAEREKLLVKPTAKPAEKKPYKIGESIEVETPKGWVKGKVLDYKSGAIDEDFLRINIQTPARKYMGAHPKSVRGLKPAESRFEKVGEKPTEKVKEKPYGKAEEAITEPAPSPQVESWQAKKVIPTGKPTGTLDPTKYEDAIKITKSHANWVAAGNKWDPRIVWEGIHTKDEVEYTPEQINTAYRTVQKSVDVPAKIADDTTLFAMPGKEVAMKAIGLKMAKQTGRGAAPKKGFKLPKPQSLPKAKTSQADHIKAVYKATAKETTRYAINGVKVEGDTIIATDGRRMFWAKGKWGKDGLYIDTASLKNGLLGKADKKQKFPSWRDIVPDVSGEKAILVDSERAWNDVRRAQTITSEESKGVVIILNLDGSLGFAVASPEVGHVEINLQPGGKVLGGVNPQYFLDAIGFHATRGNDSFELYFSNWDRPMLTKSLDGKTFTLTMPINIGDTGVSEPIRDALLPPKPTAKPKAKAGLAAIAEELPKPVPTPIERIVAPVAKPKPKAIKAPTKPVAVVKVPPKVEKPVVKVAKPVTKETEVAKFARQVRIEEAMVKGEKGEIALEPASTSPTFNKHIDYFETLQLPADSKIPEIQKKIRQINGQRLAGKITPATANRLIKAWRKNLLARAQREGVSLRTTKGGKVSPAVRKAGTYVPEEFSQYGKFKDIYPLAQDTTRSIQQIDGSLSVKEKVKMKGQAGVTERYVLWPTREISKQKLEYIKEKSVQLKKILKARRGSKEDSQINIVLEKISKEDRSRPIKDVLSAKTVKAMGVKHSAVNQAIELREFYDDLIEEQNYIRDMRGQEPIPYRQNYSPHILRDTTIWERMMAKGIKEPRKIFGDKAPLPDYIKPNRPFNPRELAREAGIPYDKRVKSAIELAQSYLVTAAKDIFNTSIIQNNKAFIQQLEAMGHNKSANYLADWTAESYAGIVPALDRTLKLTYLPRAKRGMQIFNRIRNLAVFPLNFSWNLLTQTSSLALTVGRYGSVNTMKGFYQWLKPSIRKQAAQDYYSYIIKSARQGRITRQDAQNLIGEEVSLRKTKGELARDISTYFLEQLEKLLTGTSIRAAHLHGAKRGLKGEALNNYASDGGAKTQSMYNDEDKPALLRSVLVKTGAPYQTFAYEVMNTVREWAGRTGTPTDTKLYTVWTVLRFLAAATVFAAIAKKAANKDVWSWKRPPIPFAEFWLSPIIRIFNKEYVGGSASGLTSPVETATRIAKGIDDVLEANNWRKLRNELIKYGPGVFGIPGGVQWSRTVDAIIAYSQGGVRDRRGRLLFKMEDPQDLIQAIFSGVWTTKGGREYLEKRAGKGKEKGKISRKILERKSGGRKILERK